MRIHHLPSIFLILLAAGAALHGCGLQKSDHAASSARLLSGLTIVDAGLNQRALALMSSRCVSCHASSANLGELLTQGWIRPGDAAGSLLFRRVNDQSMPPGAPLSAAEIQLVHDWIQNGIAYGGPALPPPAPTLPPGGGGSPPPGSGALAMAAFGILQRDCAACHSGGVTLGGIGYILDFERLISSGQAIPGNAAGSPLYRTLLPGAAKPMPQVGPLANADVTTIRDWINTDLRPGGSQPPPTAPPLVPTFASISANILVPRCVACHGPARAEEGVRYDTHARTLSTVNRTRPTESKLYKDSRPGESMPPGVGGLSQTQSDVILLWIQQGALNN